MLATDIPYKFGKPWAHDATTGFLTDPLPPTVAGAAASQDLGFPPITAAPVASGGIPPNIADFNGFGFYTTSWDQWQQAGGPVHYDAAFSSNIGGYPNGALLFAASGANWWLSTADNNTSDPDTGGGNWTNVAVSQEWTAGTVGSLSTGLTIVGTELTAQWQVGEVTSLSTGLTIVGTTLTAAWQFSEVTAVDASLQVSGTTLGSALFQTVSNEIGSRVLGTTYTNTTGKPMFVCVEVTSAGTNNDVSFSIDGNIICVQQLQNSGNAMSIYGMVPAGSTYEATDTSPSGGISLSRWTETF